MYNIAYVNTTGCRNTRCCRDVAFHAELFRSYWSQRFHLHTQSPLHHRNCSSSKSRAIRTGNVQWLWYTGKLPVIRRYNLLCKPWHRIDYAVICQHFNVRGIRNNTEWLLTGFTNNRETIHDLPAIAEVSLQHKQIAHTFYIVTPRKNPDIRPTYFNCTFILTMG